MNTHHDHPRKAFGLKRWLATAVVIAAAGTAVAGFANGTGLPGHHGHAAHLAAMDPAALDAHIDKMVEQLAQEASADQKARVAAIAKAAMADLRPMHTQFSQAHARLHQLLTAPVIDRAALEQLRVAQMQRMDAMSRRILVAVEDAADVLTPEQRIRFGERLKAHLH